MRVASTSPTRIAAAETSSVVQQHRLQRLREVVADQHRRQSDANRAERRVAELERQHDFERAVGVDRANLRERAAVEHRGEVFSGLDLLAFGGGEAVRDGAASLSTTAA